MQELNHLEKQLEERSIKELEEIVDTFLTSVANLRSKYGGSNYYNYVNDNNSKGTTCIEPYTVKSHLLYMLKDNHLNHMIRCKSKELLNKLDLLS